MDVLLIVLLGCSVGFAGGYAGIGGAPILVAVLVLALGFDQHEAQGTVLAVMLGPMSLPGVWVMRDRVKLLKVEALIGVLTYAVFSNLGARLALTLETQTLSSAFGALLCLLGGHYIWRRRPLATPENLCAEGPTIGQGRLPFSRWTVGVIASFIGVVGGLFGIGAGVLMVPLFISLFALHKDDARALSLTILLPPVSLGAVLEYAAYDRIDWWLAFAIFCLYFATNHLGAQWGRRHEPGRFLKVMGGALLVLGAITILGANL